MAGELCRHPQLISVLTAAIANAGRIAEEQHRTNASKPSVIEC